MISVKAGSGTVTETTRYGLPRFFQFWTDAELDAALAAHAFQVLVADDRDTGRATSG